METNELDNIGKKELFKQLKDKCKSRAKRDNYIILIFLVIVILFIGYFIIYKNGAKDIGLMVLVPIVLELGWIVLFNCRYQKRVDGIASPDQLLYEYDKNKRIVRYSSTVCWILMIIAGFIIAIVRDDDASWASAISIMIAGVVMSLMEYSGINTRAKEKEQEFREQLQELVDNK